MEWDYVNKARQKELLYRGNVLLKSNRRELNDIIMAFATNFRKHKAFKIIIHSKKVPVSLNRQCLYAEKKNIFMQVHREKVNKQLSFCHKTKDNL